MSTKQTSIISEYALSEQGGRLNVRVVQAVAQRVFNSHIIKSGRVLKHRDCRAGKVLIVGSFKLVHIRAQAGISHVHILEHRLGHVVERARKLLQHLIGRILLKHHTCPVVVPLAERIVKAFAVQTHHILVVTNGQSQFRIGGAWAVEQVRLSAHTLWSEHFHVTGQISGGCVRKKRSIRET